MPGLPVGHGGAMTPRPLASRSAGGTTLVACDGITVRLGDRPVLENVSIAVEPGEIVTLIGPNGSGKTTLVRTILGLQRPYDGEVRQRDGLRIGYVPQRLSIDPILPLTVRRFLRLGGKRDEIVLQRAADEVGGSDLLPRQIEELSGGELQRMALARALLREPELLVLDEPLQGVDFTGQLALFNLIDRVRRERGCGVLMVSHDLHLVMKGTDRVFCLNRHICCSGQPETVSQHPEYLALFGPRAEESLAVYSHSHDHDHALSGEVMTLPGSERGADNPDEDRRHSGGAEGRSE